MTRRKRHFRWWHIGCATILLFAFFASSCSSYVQPILPSTSPPSGDEESRISREFRREAKKHFKFVTDPEVERYIENIGQRILSVMGPQPFDYRFFVVENAQLNAFAVPGGSIYFFSGLIEKAKSTAEVAGVLGHELVHITGRHMARSSGPDAISLLSLLSMALLARSGGSAAQAAGIVGQAAAVTRQVAYNRQLEMEADTLGVRYMAAAGYDPKGSLAFLKTLEQERALNPIDVPPYMMTHPVSQERVANVELVIRSLPKTEPRAKDPDPLEKVQAIIRVARQDGDAVLREFEKKAAENPDSAGRLYLLGFAHHLRGQLADAQRNYEKARSIDPQIPGLDRDLGRLYGQLGTLPEARAAFERALALEPKEPLTYLYLGELYEHMSELREAAGAYLNAHHLSPLWDKPLNRLGNVYGKLNRLGDGYYYLGRSLILQDEDDRAMAYFENAIKIFGEHSLRGQSIRDEVRSLRARRR